MKFLLVLFLIMLDCARSQYNSNLPSDSNLNGSTSVNASAFYNIFKVPFENKDGSASDSFPYPTPKPGTETCRCVTSQLCNDGSLNSDGTANVDINSKPNKCGSYLLKCCEEKYIIKSMEPQIKTNKGCGHRNEEGVGYRITGANKEVQFGEFPWMVAILTEEALDGKPEKLLIYKCGASLIHPEMVLTSAHCVDTLDPSTLVIRAGEWDTRSKDERVKHQDRDVKGIIIHPGYIERSLHNDIALIIVKSPFQLSNSVNTVCLPSQDEVLRNIECIATGWGKNSFELNSTYQSILKMVKLPIIQSDVCQDIFRTTRVGPYFKLDQSFICAGGVAGRDTCKGDGGSPLVCPIQGKRGRYQQRGLVSWGIGCADALPGAYGNVAYFRNWIDAEMFKLNLNTSTYTI